MGGETRSKSGFHQGMTKTRISNPSFSSSRIKQREFPGCPLVTTVFSTAQSTVTSLAGEKRFHSQKKTRIKWGKHNLLLTMSVKRKKKN